MLELSPQNARALDLLVKLQLRQRDFAAADATAKKIKQAYPDKSLGYYVEGLVHQARGEVDSSIKAFELALAQEPDAVDVLAALVRAHLTQKNSDAALERIYGALTRNPDSVALLNLRGEVLLVERDFHGAKAVLERAIQIDPKLPVLHRNLALAHMGLGDMEGAVVAYEAGIKANEGDFSLVVALAALYESVGQPDAAIAQYEGLLAQAPDSQLAANNLAMLLVTHRPEDASSLDRARELAARLEGSENPAFLDTVAWVAYQRGETDRAIEILERVVRSAPEVPIFHYHLGAAYHQRGDKEVARKHLERAVAASADFPGKSEAAVMLEQVKGG